MNIIKTKRAYESASKDDGFRVYIDKLWPRGLSHETFHYDLWEKGIAPSTELREWFHEDPDNRWEGFREKYTDELKNSPIFADFRKLLTPHSVVTLLYSSHDELHNNAVVVRELLLIK